MSKVLVVKGFSPPKETGVHHRLMCLTGKNKGCGYLLKSKRIVMGRGDNADIKIDDSKSSREHLELVLSGISYIVTDLKSQNGVVVNDLKISQHRLENNDKIIVGQTVFKYNVIKVEEEHDEDDDDDDDDDDEDDDNDNEEEYEKKNARNQSPPKKKGLLVGVIVIGLVSLLALEPENAQGPKTKSGVRPNDLSTNIGFSNTKTKADELEKETMEKVNAAIHRGLREYRETNFFRAIDEFNFALVLSPNNAKASFYLNKTKQALDEDIEQNFMKGKQDFDALKYRGAIKSYCSIMRMLHSYKDDERYKNAEENIRLIEEKMGLDKGEIKCF